MRKLLALAASLILTVTTYAEDYVISGKVVEKQGGAAVEMATVRLMNADSTFITGVGTGSDGSFKVNAKKAGSYILKISFIGYNVVYRNVTLTPQKSTAVLGEVKMESDDHIIDVATVTTRAAKVQIVKDTFVYNVSAYRVPEGSTLEALIDQLPGAVVDDNGGITLNGKKVSEIRVDGKDFFKGDTKVAMKNLPVSLIDKVKAYDMKSDCTRETGIDDGNDKTVLDLRMKRKLKGSWLYDLDLAYGNHKRYYGNLFANYFNETSRVSAFGSMNNLGDRRFRGGGPRFGGGGGNGLSASKMFGLDGYWNNGKKDQEAGYFELNGNVRYRHTDNDALSRSNSETFLNTASGSSSFNNSAGHSYSDNTDFNTEMNLRWKPDTLTGIYLRPEYSYQSGNNSGISRSATFNSNPYDVVESPLDSIFSSYSAVNIPAALASITVNRNLRQSLSEGNGNTVNISAGITRRLGKKGRSISLDGGFNYSENNSYNWSISDIYYYRHNKQTYNNQYSTSPSKNWGYNTRLSYSEPIVGNLFFQGSYNYRYSYSDRDRSFFQLDSLADWGAGTSHLIGSLPGGDSLYTVLNRQNSRYATYKDYVHSINLGLRYVKNDINFSAGVRLQPQHTLLDYKKNNLDTTVTRNVLNIAPNIRLRYNITRYSRLEFRYRGSSNQPSMTDLLDVTDTGDPLNIVVGNPGLKPSWTNNVNAYYNNYWTERQRSISVDLFFSQTSNGISNSVTYDTSTGIRTTKPENINGNWNTGANVMFNTAFGNGKQFDFFSFSSANFNHRVGYISTKSAGSGRNKMKTLGIGEHTRLSYRNDFIEVGINGNLNYDHSRSNLRKLTDLDTWSFAYGGSFQWNTTWKMSFSTDVAMNSRRGYNDNSMNTNELIWNAQISQSFFKQNAATVSLQLYDILHRQSNISRTINSISRRDSWNNGIHSYFMVHFIYCLNLFNGTGARIGKGGDRGGGFGGGNRGPVGRGLDGRRR